MRSLKQVRGNQMIRGVGRGLVKTMSGSFSKKEALSSVHSAEVE